MKKTRLPEEALKFFRRAGARGGKARAARHTEAELSAWGKLGGRPPKGTDAKSKRRAE